MGKLSDICDFINEKIKINQEVNDRLCGTYISTENMLPNKQGVTMASSIPTSGSITVYKESDTLVSNIRPYFKKIWYAENDGGCSNDVLVFRAKKGTNPLFVYYTLSNDEFFNYSMKTSKGTKMPRGDKKAIMNYPIHNFDLNTQIKTTKILRVVDELIRLNNMINNNLVAYLFRIRMTKTSHRRSMQITILPFKNHRRSTNYTNKRIISQSSCLFAA